MAKSDDETDTIGFEDKCWAAADLLHKYINPVEYKHVLLHLIFFKCISDVGRVTPSSRTTSSSALDRAADNRTRTDKFVGTGADRAS